MMYKEEAKFRESASESNDAMAVLWWMLLLLENGF
jgi:hypothetical protein